MSSAPSCSVSGLNNDVKILKLKSSEGEIFEVKQTVAVQSRVLKEMVEEGCTDGDIPLHNVTGPTLSKILEWCNKHEDDGVVLSEEKKEELKKWESEFMDALSLDDLYFLLKGSNYLNMKELLGCACEKVAEMIRGLSPEKIREKFNIKNDFSPEEEAEIRKENAWAFDN
ncbi:hypothetical protein ACOSQ2_012042 [Xanthoceras sorbifolium]